jgi:hypothetical protein
VFVFAYRCVCVYVCVCVCVCVLSPLWFDHAGRSLVLCIALPAYHACRQPVSIILQNVSRV